MALNYLLLEAIVRIGTNCIFCDVFSVKKLFCLILVNLGLFLIKMLKKKLLVVELKSFADGAIFFQDSNLNLRWYNIT
jgi:hypothetical protein